MPLTKEQAIEVAKRCHEQQGINTVAYQQRNGEWIAVERSVFNDRQIYAPHAGMDEAVFFGGEL